MSGKPDSKNFNTEAKNYSGELEKSTEPKDISAHKLAERIGGKAQVYFGNDPEKKEFDVISDDYIGEAKPYMPNIGSKFRKQAKKMFEAARVTGRIVYYHFPEEPGRDIIRTLKRYSKRYGVDYVIDTKPFTNEGE